jgi:hypothetical protein
MTMVTLSADPVLSAFGDRLSAQADGVAPAL